ncbi:hypothetical protein [Amycolatopsis sp. NPDC049868]|uniref:hypothetical protein n=1 Tax=Amycolatopsis sp. NPDC049868 TaxID=3363934 RepID=UPI0037A27992
MASYDVEGLDAAIDWSCDHLQDDDILTGWTHLKSNLRNCDRLEQFVARYRNVKHVTGRGGGYVRGTGPVLMAWPDMADLGQLIQAGGYHVRALCVVTWNADAIRPWVTAVRPTILGDDSPWMELTPELDGVVLEALKSITRTVNHNNTISAGFEKDQVVGTLLALRDAGIAMDAEAIEGWSLANGWSGKNPQRLGQYVRDINAGKRPRCRAILRADYADYLRRRAAGDDD